MKMLKVSKILSLALATVVAISFFSVNSFAATRAETHKRALTAEEIATITPLVDWQYYQKVNPDLVKAFGRDNSAALVNHFLEWGIWEERQPRADFNVDAYASRNLDLRSAFGDDIIAYYMHYAQSTNADRYYRPTPTLEDSYYKNTNVYSVYDFVKGQTAPRAGALPIQTYNYHPKLHFAWEDEQEQENNK